MVGGGIIMAICFYRLLVKQYLTTTQQFDDKIVQEIFDEAFKHEAKRPTCFWWLKSRKRGLIVRLRTQWCYAKVDLKLPRRLRHQYDAMTHIGI